MARRFEVSIKFSPSNRPGRVWAIPKFPKTIGPFDPSQFYLVIDKENDLLIIALVDSEHAQSGGGPVLATAADPPAQVSASVCASSSTAACAALSSSTAACAALSSSP
jgi:hypothetical protein